MEQLIMNTMYCFQCVYKHLSVALSYGKQILSGYDKSNDLDHRIDFLGQLINAEHHIELINIDLYKQLSTFRKTLQAKRLKINADDLQIIRDYYKKIQQIEDNIFIDDTPYKDNIQFNPNIVYKAVNNLQSFDLSYNLLKKNLYNYDKIQVLKSTVDLSKYKDVQILNISLKQYLELADDFILMNENTSFLKQFNARQIINTYTQKQVDKQTVEYLNKKGVQQKIFNYDETKPQLIKVDEIKKIDDYQGDFAITVYSYLSNNNTLYNDNNITAFVDRQICCSLLQKLKNVPFVKWNEKGLNSLKGFIKG